MRSVLTGVVARPALLPLHTDRLTLRAFERADITRLTAYRNDPDVASYQDWPLPYTRDLAHDLLDELDGLTGPVAGRWFQLAVDDGTGLVGDLAVWLDESAELAMIGYTLGAEHQGRGYATEAVDALVDALFERIGVHRIAATLDPENLASARVLERTGFRHEGRSVAAAKVRGEWCDDERYALLRHDLLTWRSRPCATPTTVELLPITASNVRDVARLEVHPTQRRFVATVAESFGDALAPEPMHGTPVTAWYRAVSADGELAGFVMLAETGGVHPPWLWRLLVDRRHQGRGIGRRVVELIAERARSQGAHVLATSYVDRPGGPADFYRRLGFVPTGEYDEGEVVAHLDLTRPTPDT